MPVTGYQKIAIQVAECLSEVDEFNINSSTKKMSDSVSNVKLNEDEKLVHECTCNSSHNTLFMGNTNSTCIERNSSRVL